MAELGASGLVHGFGGPPLLDGVGLQIERGERVGLLGRNGCGKSTLLKILAGSIEPDDGELVLRPGVTLAGLAQDVPDGIGGTVAERVAGVLEAAGAADWEVEAKTDRILGELGLEAEASVAKLSAGAKRRVLLAEALVLDPDVLILDEPTNHLDLGAILKLEERLLQRSGSLLFVTHDRAFLRSVATRILDLDRGQIRSYDCDYATYLGRKEALLEAEEKQTANFDKKLAQEEVWIRRGIKARRTRDQGRVRALERMREERRARRTRVGQASATTQQTERSGQLVAEVENVSIGFGDKRLIQNFTTTVLRGDRVGIVGPNGAGKTTFLKVLLGELPPDTGHVRLGTRLEIGRFDQLHGDLDPEKTLQENVVNKGDTVMVNGHARHVISYLGDFLFEPEQVRRSIRYLSGGERNRLQLAKLLAQPANLLILDEPTNDLDLETLELLEQLLLEYQGTLIVVSHDREFLDNVVTQTFMLDGVGGIIEHVGGYTDALRRQAATAAPAANPKGKGKSKSAPNAAPKAAPKKPQPARPAKLTFTEKHELERLPAQIERLETDVAKRTADMAAPDFYRKDSGTIAKANAELASRQAELEQIYARWETLASRAEG